MYISSSKETCFQDLPWSAKLIANAVDEKEGTWGAWFYQEFAIATFQDMDGEVAYYEMDISLTEKDVMEIKRHVSAWMREGTECSHWHDCCGCMFFSGLEIVRAYKNHWIIKESWGRNI